jgi:hypothetical protein
MTFLNDISDDLVDDLLGAPATTLAFYDEENPNAKLQFCSRCGACETPEKCAWAYQCPTCMALPTQPCRNERGGLSGHHIERIEYARART